ncbi:ATPase [Tardiphaga sp. OK245]|nr:ATPase [Tardiphaga sp. OK245]
MKKPLAPYSAFGSLLTTLRRAQKIDRQDDLATLLDVKQQTVSRWEAGTSRPREKQLPLIASKLSANLGDLRAAAGFTDETVVASFDQPFPIDALSPESFERFTAALLQRLYPEAAVHQMGGRGHTQDGTDILATMSDGAVYSFQCKRTEEFGPQKVHAAVSKHTVNAVRKIIVLSRVASPQAREAIASYKGWDIWDRDDLSLKLRGLAKVDQLSLVDIFFSGRRFELLGITEESVWETAQDFFAAFENADGLFNHVWNLVGREGSLAELTGHLTNDKSRVIFLTGSGGSGKTRVLKEGIARYGASGKRQIVLFLSRTAEITKKSLEELGHRPALLVVDDAHDRTDLSLLFQYTAVTKGVRLVLALRPYGLSHLKAQASNFSLLESIGEVVLPALTKDEAEQLALQVLKKEAGPLHVAKDIARLTYDCPLATVVGAQIVAREKKHLDLAKNEEDFRITLFGRFEDVIAGELGQKADAEPLKRLLKVLALFQPFYLDDKSLFAAIQNLEGLQPHDASRLLKLLIDSGVLFKRGSRYRLSPDVLADYIIEANCVGLGHQSTGYAEAAFDSASDGLVENLLLNLGKLDWRLSNGNASNSRLLDGIWAKLKPRSEYSDPHIGAVKAVAFYQPLKAIEFGEGLIRQGKFLKQLPQIFRYAAYNLEHLPRAAAALWELGKDDERQTNQHPEHAIRVLAELCEVQPNKPFAYNQAILEFGLALAVEPGCWNCRHTPLDILTPIFKTEGHTTTSQAYTMSFNPFTVHADAVKGMRGRVVDLILELMENPNIRVATRAADAIADALRYPMGLFGASVADDARAKWTKVFCETLESLEKAIRSRAYDPLVLVGIAKAVSWHANYSKSETAKYAKGVRAALDSSLDYKVLATLTDGYGTELRRIDAKNYQALLDKHLNSVAAELLDAYPDSAQLRNYIEGHLSHIQSSTIAGRASPHVLYGAVLLRSPSLVTVTIEDALQNPDSLTARFASEALRILWGHDVVAARRSAKAYLSSNSDGLKAAVGGALSRLDFAQVEYGDAERSAIETLIAAEPTGYGVGVVSSGIYAVRSLSRFQPDEALRLALQVNLGESAWLADDLLTMFSFGVELPFSRLSEADVGVFLQKLMALRELEGHWIETFLAEASLVHPHRTFDFFLDRIARAIAEDAWGYRPINHGPYVHIPLRFKESAEYGALLAKYTKWMTSVQYDGKEDMLFRYRSRELFEAAFGFDDEVISFIVQWSNSADEAEFGLLANILEEAPASFVFTHKHLAIDLLTKAKRMSEKVYKSLESALYASAHGGVRGGVAGEPFPRDVEMKASCEEILASLSKFSPAYELYSELHKGAQQEIERAVRSREEFED